jgi:AcrR family transcriptional regulator
MPIPGSNTQAASPRWQRRPEARPDEILDAAWQVFGEHGFARARLSEVAERAGVSKGTLYLYFNSKETLFKEMVRARIVSSVVAGEKMLKAHRGSARQLLEAFVRRMWHLQRYENMASISRLVTSELGSFPELGQFYYDEVVARTRRLVDSIMERGVASGEFRPSVRAVATRVIPSLLTHSAQTQSLFSTYDSANFPDEVLLDGILELVFEGVSSHPQPPSRGADA